MKQKYFYLIGLLAIVMGVFVLGGCSKDDDDDNDNSIVVGTWQYKSRTFTVTYTFASDGNFTRIERESTHSTRNDYTGTYSVSGNELTIHLTKHVAWSQNEASVAHERSYDNTNSYNFSVSGNELHLKELDCSKCEEEVFIKQ